MKPARIVQAIVMLSSLLLLVTCGGGGGGGSTTPPPAPQALRWQVVPLLGESEVGIPFSYQLKAYGGTPPYAFAADANRPAWLTVNASTGELSGTPGTGDAATTPFKVSVTDAKSASVSSDVTLLVHTAPSIQTADMPTLKVNTSAQILFNITGGSEPFDVLATGLPAGLYLFSLNGPSFSIRGTPTEFGTFPVTLSLKDGLSGRTSANVTLTVKNALVPKQDYFQMVQGRPFSGSVHVLSGTPPFTFSATMPYGLTMSSSGEISGTPLAPSWMSFPAWTQFHVTVTDSDTPPQTADIWDSLALYGPIQFTFTDLRIHTQPTFYTLAQGGFGNLKLSLKSGSLPPGMSLDPTYPTISGTPAQTGVFVANIHAEDAAAPPQFADQAVTFTVLSPEPMIAATSFPVGQLNQPYAAEFNVSGGTPPFTWRLDGALPAGLSFDGNGRIEGAPTEVGSFFVQAYATDSSTPAQIAQGYGTVKIQVNAAKVLGRNDTVTTATPAANSLLASISPFDDPSSEGPDRDYYKLFATADSTVDIRVTPQGPLDSVLEIVDANGIRLKTCNDLADDAPDAATGITADTTPNGFDDECMNDDVDFGVDRTSRLQFKVPGASGETVKYYAHVFDWTGNARPDFTYLMSISDGVAPFRMADSVQVTGEKGTPIAQANFGIQASGGIRPYKFTVAPGSPNLPAGLTMDQSGTVTGTPTVAGRSYAMVQSSDSSQPPQTALTEVDFNIVEPLSMPSSAPPAVTGVPYSAALPITGGVQPFSFLGTNWTPQQCCMAVTAIGLWGTPQYAGDFTATVFLSDGLFRSYQRTVTIHINPGPLTIAVPVPQKGKVYNYYSLPFTAKGGSAPLTYSVAGSVPPGLAFDSQNIALAGYPTQAGTYQLTVTVTDSRGVSTPLPVSIVVDP